MYTLLIADDEPLIRNGVKKIIDWESYGKIMWTLF